MSNCTIMCNLIFVFQTRISWTWYRKKYLSGTGINTIIGIEDFLTIHSPNWVPGTYIEHNLCYWTKAIISFFVSWFGLFLWGSAVNLGLFTKWIELTMHWYRVSTRNWPICKAQVLESVSGRKHTSSTSYGMLSMYIWKVYSKWTPESRTTMHLWCPHLSM